MEIKRKKEHIIEIKAKSLPLSKEELKKEFDKMFNSIPDGSTIVKMSLFNWSSGLDVDFNIIEE